MQIRFFQPFSEFVGTETMRVELPTPTPVREILRLVGRRSPSFRKYVPDEGDEVQNFFAIVVRGDEILKLGDRVENHEVIKILPPISGG